MADFIKPQVISLALVMAWAQAHSAEPNSRSLEDFIRSGLTSDNYAEITARQELEEVPHLLSRTTLLKNATFGISYLEDRRSPVLDTLPNRSLSTGVNLGVNTQLSTGTGISAELSHAKSRLDFTRDPSASFFETKATLTLSQSLWRNFLGSGTRAALRAGETASDANRLMTVEAEESWFQSLLESYYKAWLAQKNERATLENVRRRERLSEVTKRKLQSGLTDAADELQVEGALLKAKSQHLRGLQSSQEKWDELASFTLKGAAAIPPPTTLTLDTPMTRALELCASAAPQSYSTLSRLEQQSKSARWKIQEKESALRPILDLKASVFANGVSDRASPAVDQLLRRDTPGWQLGLQLTVPFSDDEKQAELHQARALEIQTEALATQARRNLGLQWKNACADLNRWAQATEHLSQALQNQARRTEVEERRFKLARTGALNVVQAGDDLAQSELELHQAEIETRLSAWKVRRLGNDVPRYLKAVRTVEGR